VVAVSVVLISWCGLLHAEEDKGIYLWKNPRGKTHLTEEPPPKGGSVEERITQTAGPPAASRRRALEEVKENQRENS
jgi:hypothetical protein